MSEGEIIPKNDLQENQDINTSQPANIISNNQIEQENKNNTSNEPLQKEELKFGQYLLTPLQSILLNKKFPSGFKLETEENILKSLELIKAQEKKHKQAQKNNLQKSQRSSNKLLQPNKKNKNSNNIDNIPNDVGPEKYKIIMQCKGGFAKIKESKYFSKYYISIEPNIPSLSNVEKKLNNYEYSSLYEFEMDVRNIWNYYFNLNPNDEIAKKMSEDWEKICMDLENTNSEVSVTDIKKRTDNIKKEMEKIKDHREDISPVPTKKSGQNSESNKPMSVEEKNQLGNDIRSLNKEQLKGIIRILKESETYPKTKYFEFDIDQLPNKKLRELEKYVKECISLNNKNNNKQHGQNINNSNKKENLKENKNNKNNNNTANTNNNNVNSQQQMNQSSNTKNKEINKNMDVEQDNTPVKKNNKQNSIKKSEKRDNSLSSDSISSDSSLSN
jgi:hypothetical protein